MNNQENSQQANADLEKIGYHQQLKRSLGVWQLTAFGLNYMIPIAPAIIFGFILAASGGTVAIPYLLAAVGMVFTANSYALMINVFPVAGSLYSYVSKGFSAHVGFIAGWVLLLDYILIPTVTSMSASVYIHEFFPHIPYLFWLFIFSVLTGLVNLLGAQLMARVGLLMLLIGELVIFIGFMVWSHAVTHGTGVGHLLSIEPFHFSSVKALATATSMAVLSYLGFDAITTLTEEAVNPKKDVPRAIFLSVIIGGITMFLTGYLAMLVIPNWRVYAHSLAWQSTTLFHVANISGGHAFGIFYTAGFLLAMAVFNIVATAAGARLLFGMGRDDVLPKQIFGAINKKFNSPHWNIMLIVVIEYTLGSTIALNHVASLVNYGALLGFSLLNLSVIWFYYIRKNKHPANVVLKQQQSFPYHLRRLLCPLLGLVIMAWVMSGLQWLTLLVGSIWLLIGVIYGAIHSKGYRIIPRVFQ